ncbi:CapA family protein [Hazenella coriacea]|uniref:Poly-gamma-glutamate synthesis protein (Capsule biosynthesis protein) n=1 Tax=Hazenella coriacea TaxID=1179467 RepID=A0A4R3L8H6_9BACL|nr:CapA family protein [Hazenella coriacea]TCS93816.1 poly-gamma-glutamate synthesis protein (capsule biosynthesis protein) [Hazenella coriacea]
MIVLIIVPFKLFDVFSDFTAQGDQPSSETAKSQKSGEPQTVQIAAFGDIMMHSPQIKAGQQSDGSYDFSSFFKEIKPYIEIADIAIGNFETTLAGSAKPYSGYPTFNSPDEITTTLKNAGVDVVSTANNHSMDTGPKGVVRTYQTMNEAGIKVAGTASSAEERKPVIIKQKGITFAFLAYTEHTNGLPVPEDRPYLVNRIDSEQIAKDIKEAREMGAEFVCVSLHYGVEYQRQPNDMQLKVSRQALEDGADVIFGSHPHVLQPMEKVTVNGKEKFIIYSMGNFVSNQKDPHTDEGIIVYVDVEKNPSNQDVQLKNVSYLPTFVHKYPQGGKTQYVILPTETNQPSAIPNYPSLNRSKYQTTWDHTQKVINEKGSFETFSLSK